MASAIELYREAYDLDYRKGDWEAAEELYRKIVTRYPGSEEKEYALVHLERLEKLKADPDDRELKPSRAVSQGSGLAFGVFNFFLILFVLLALAGLGYLYWQQHRELIYTDLLLQGQVSEKAGDFGRASQLYKQACQMHPSKALAFRLLAELYLGRGERELAQNALEVWRLAVPHDEGLKDFESRLLRAGKKKGRK